LPQSMVKVCAFFLLLAAELGSFLASGAGMVRRCGRERGAGGAHERPEGADAELSDAGKERARSRL
jgi:hypothetical protein